MTRKKQKKTPGRRMPALRIHKQSQRCYGTFNGQMVWFGARSDPATQERFDAHLAQWLARGRKPEEPHDDSISVKSVVARYLRHLEEKHDEIWLRNNGNRLTQSLKPLLRLQGTEPATAFSPLKLKAVRQDMIASDRLCRSEINARVQIIRQVFRWAVSEELIPPLISHGLNTIVHLRPGEYGVREGRVRGPVAEDVVFETMKHLHPVAAALVELLWLTGARPSEIFNLCPEDIDRSGMVWIATLRKHKTAKMGKIREIGFGPRSQRVLQRYLDRVPLPPADRPIFSPALAMTEHQLLRREARQSRVWNSHVQRYEREAARRKTTDYGDRYTAATLRTTIRRAVARANRGRQEANEARPERESPMLPHWTPYQLRHAALTRIRAARGIEAAKAIGGHSNTIVTEGYSRQAERELARQIAGELG